MPAWTGGPCPGCGEHMPENLIHCQSCRTLLNSDLESDSVEIPQFIPLQEISAMVEVDPVGYFVACPHCKQELRINKKYLGENVQCKLCDKRFVLDRGSPQFKPAAFYASCPHCKEELRASHKYMGTKVACKHCGGQITFVEKAPA